MNKEFIAPTPEVRVSDDQVLKLGIEENPTKNVCVIADKLGHFATVTESTGTEVKIMQIDVTELDGQIWELRTEGLIGIYEKLGFSFEDDSSHNSKASRVPTPETLTALARQNFNIRLRLMDNQGDIPARDYLAAYADGEHPVATSAANYYRHDTDGDHLPAIILGGSELRDYLAEIAIAGLSGGTEADIIKAGTSIDELTSTISDSFYADGLLAPEHLGGRMISAQNITEIISYTAHDWAKKFGLNAGRVESIMKTVYTNAKEYSIGEVPEIYALAA